MASVILWCFENYYYYAIAIIIITVISVTAEVVETRRNMLNIRDMAMYECSISIRSRDSTGTYTQQSSTALVPGDVVEIPEGTKMPCDCILLSGSAVVNEAMLTGESIPVVKTALPATEDVYDPESDKKYTVFSGTEVMQTRSGADGGKIIAFVLRTGFGTLKGALVRYIIYPKPSKFNFYSDSYKYIVVLLCMSLIGIFVQIFNGSSNTAGDIILKCLDLITITVPPALPACMSVGISFAIIRLKDSQVYCISPPRINVAGKINTYCFDKTGTLTEDKLTTDGYRAAAMVSEKEATFYPFCQSIKALVNDKLVYGSPEEYEKLKNSAKTLFVDCMASCHCVARIKGRLIGDPLDVEMFNSTGWMLEEIEELRQQGAELSEEQRNFAAFVSPRKEKPTYKLGIVRRFDFSSKLQRMSVLAKNSKTGAMWAFVKGSPEKMVELSRLETVPTNFQEVLTIYAQRGCRVLALAAKPLEVSVADCQSLKREAVEQSLTFLGFYVLRNSLKKATASVIAELQNANIRPIMVTGDNALTAISVGQECGIIQQNAKVYLAELVELPGRKIVKWNLVSKQAQMEEVRLAQIAASKPFLPTAPTKSKSNSEVDARVTPDSPEQVSPTNRVANEEAVLNMEATPAEQEMIKLPADDSEKSLVLTGNCFGFILECDPMCKKPVTQTLLKSANIFARMSPEQKALLVDALQNIDCVVGMCGDGANDCAALKGADIGISLSEAEASIAAPFTSKVPDITCVPKVLKEGRSALTTSFQCFKFMALYSMIEFTSVTIMYTFDGNLTDMQFLMIDLVVIIPLAITMSWTRAASKLSIQLPESNLLSPSVLTSIIGQSVIQALCQAGMYMYVRSLDWYEALDVPDDVDPDSDEASMCHANTVSSPISHT